MSALRKSEEEIVRIGSGDDLRTYIDTLAGHGPQHESVVEVDRDDDLTSIRTKLESTRVPRVVLVVPGGVKTLRDGLEFRILRRLQRELGLELIIVSDDLSRRGLARENGFRNVFRSMRAYYGSKTPAPDSTESVPFTDPEEFSPSLGISRWGILLGVVLLSALAAVAYLVVPVARVTVYPETREMVRDVEVLVEIGGPRLDIPTQRLSGQVLQERVQVSDSINVKDVPAPPGPPSGNPPSSGPQPGTKVTLEVRDALRQRLLQQATAQAAEQLKSRLRSNESMPDAGVRIQVLGERYDRNIGDAAETLGGSAEILMTGIAYNNDDFNRLVFSLWSQDIPRDFTAIGSLKLDPPAVVTAEAQHMTLRVRVSGILQRRVDEDAIASAVRGKGLAEARSSAAKAADSQRPPEVEVWPSWADRALRVQVKAAPSSASGANGGQ